MNGLIAGEKKLDQGLHSSQQGQTNLRPRSLIISKTCRATKNCNRQLVGGELIDLVTGRLGNWSTRIVKLVRVGQPCVVIQLSCSSEAASISSIGRKRCLRVN